MKKIIIVALLTIPVVLFADTKSEANARLQTVTETQAKYSEISTDMDNILREGNNREKYNVYLKDLYNLESQIAIVKGKFYRKNISVSERNTYAKEFNSLKEKYNTLSSEFSNWVRSL